MWWATTLCTTQPLHVLPPRSPLRNKRCKTLCNAVEPGGRTVRVTRSLASDTFALLADTETMLDPPVTHLTAARALRAFKARARTGCGGLDEPPQTNSKDPEASR